MGEHLFVDIGILYFFTHFLPILSLKNRIRQFPHSAIYYCCQYWKQGVLSRQIQDSVKQGTKFYAHTKVKRHRAKISILSRASCVLTGSTCFPECHPEASLNIIQEDTSFFQKNIEIGFVYVIQTEIRPRQ